MKKLLSIILAFSLIFTIIGSSYAERNTSIQNDKYTNYESSIKIKDEDSYIPRLNIDYSNYEDRSSLNKQKHDSLIEPEAVVPLEGDTRISLTNLQTDGVTYQDKSSEGTTLSSILNVSMAIASYYLTTVQSVVMDIATICLDIEWSEVVLSEPGQAILSHSYSYYSKLGQVWNGSYWVTKVDIEARKIYRHEWASFAGIDGYTHTDSYDFIPPNGYYEIGEEKKFEFDDDDWIRQEANDIYFGGWPIYVNAWTH